MLVTSNPLVVDARSHIAIEEARNLAAGACQGLAFSPEEEEQAMNTYAKFFEKHYEFYNRKIEWVWEQGTCEISPPDLPCFRNEVKRLNAKHKPFAVFWANSTMQAEFFDEWSRLGVMNAGGWHFNAEFNNRLRPYHWDVFMDGTRTARNIADYWCKKMQGKNATLAGSPDLQAKKRKLGILTQAFPVTKKNAQDLYAMVTGGKCGSTVDGARQGRSEKGHHFCDFIGCGESLD